MLGEALNVYLSENTLPWCILSM